jgi:hypothetical protein
VVAPVADVEGATQVSLNKIFHLHLLRRSTTSFTGSVRPPRFRRCDTWPSSQALAGLRRRLFRCPRLPLGFGVDGVLWNAMMHSRGSELLRPVSATASHGFLLRLLQRYNDDCFDDIWTSQDEANLSLLNAPQSSHLSLHFVACNRQLRRRSTATQTASKPQMVVLSASPPHGMRSGGLSSTAGTDESSIF